MHCQCHAGHAAEQDQEGSPDNIIYIVKLSIPVMRAHIWSPTVQFTWPLPRLKGYAGYGWSVLGGGGGMGGPGGGGGGGVNQLQIV